ncbi:MAG: 6-phosphogluconolactonase, eukaryotic type [uncultured Thermomicrobiales bacterium]|uniref:6-phosphogluconolactonase n=1 Tax=uncultured Thermomicrobiales bacterium TaxID=1645740 RepID=A0A6J4UZZ8_9BACT|nr:MAG: 6-phosphogluconolactonase, eukaryotic type [uncultured Thermomicrobiales bacterium]
MNATQTELDFGTRGVVRVVPDGEALARAAAETFVRATAAAVADRGMAFVALSGGSTPKRMGELLASDEFRDRVPWEQIEVFWGDERWVALDDPQSNAGEAMRALLDKVPIPPSRVNPIPTEVSEPEVAGFMYATQLRTVFGETDGVPRFDLVLLGMGDDGHTASLFPGTAAIREQEALVVAHRVEKLEAVRLTLTPPVLNAGREVVFLVGGAAKAATLKAVLEGPEKVDELPSQAIRPTDGPLVWLVDEAAAAALSRATDLSHAGGG